jgi:hypothetical protein
MLLHDFSYFGNKLCGDDDVAGFAIIEATNEADDRTSFHNPIEVDMNLDVFDNECAIVCSVVVSFADVHYSLFSLFTFVAAYVSILSQSEPKVNSEF